MKESYVDNYLKAIENPLPELKETFAAELNFLKKNVNVNSLVLDVGCGAGRPAKSLVPFVRRIVAIDNDQKMLDLAVEKCKGVRNIEIKNGDALSMDFLDNTFDLAYASYNLIGSLQKDERQKLFNEMNRVVKVGGKIINFTWKNNEATTKFLKNYYPSIGIDIIKIDDGKTITSKQEFDRLSKKELLKYYENVKLTSIKFFDIGSVWVAMVGVK